MNALRQKEMMILEMVRHVAIRETMEKRFDVPPARLYQHLETLASNYLASQRSRAAWSTGLGRSCWGGMSRASMLIQAFDTMV